MIHEDPKKQNFRRELTELLNRYSIERGSNTPDFVLVSYVINCLISFEQATRERALWYYENDKRSAMGIES